MVGYNFKSELIVCETGKEGGYLNQNWYYNSIFVPIICREFEKAPLLKEPFILEETTKQPTGQCILGLSSLGIFSFHPPLDGSLMDATTYLYYNLSSAFFCFQRAPTQRRSRVSSGRIASLVCFVSLNGYMRPSHSPHHCSFNQSFPQPP